jgi:hypothetical protein
MRVLAAFAILTTSLLAADVATISGIWNLNVNRSKWHRAPRPTSARLAIEHHEPKLKYESTITDADGQTRNFTFDGVIDGKDHNGVIAQRLSPFSTLLTLKSDDGGTQEITNTITQDGNHLIRRIQSSGPNGKLIWTELYDKAQP